MAFSNKTKYEKYQQAHGQCECTRLECGHVRRCTRILTSPIVNHPNLNSVLDVIRGIYTDDSFKYPGFEFHHKISVAAGGSDSLENCEFLCKDCHINTRSFGTNLTR